VREVAALLRISRATVYKLVAEGTLKAVRISNSIRVRGEDLERFAQGPTDAP
jgi:excisionase family DNA binding protein